MSEGNGINIGSNIGSPIITGKARDVIVSSGSSPTVPGIDNDAISALFLLIESEKVGGKSTSEKMQAASAVIDKVESNIDLKERLIRSLKVGGVKAFEQMLSHPIASFVINALEEWAKG